MNPHAPPAALHILASWCSPRDPRFYQISVLSGLLVFGLSRLDFDVSPAQALGILATALATQWLASRATHVAFDPRSALISALSLCLLLRTNIPLLALVAAVIAVVSKFVVRWRGKHIFNPTNGAIVLLMLVTGGRPGVPGLVWVSPGQWGHVAYFGFLMACLGGLVVYRAARSDVTFAFMAAYAGSLFARAAWLGQPWAAPLHQLESGAFLRGRFFLISDPKPTPDARLGRILFAALGALGAAFTQFVLYRPNGLLWSLAFWSMAVPLIDRWLPGRRYAWEAPRAARRTDDALPHGVPGTVPMPSPVLAEPVPLRARAIPRVFERSSP